MSERKVLNVSLHCPFALGQPETDHALADPTNRNSMFAPYFFSASLDKPLTDPAWCSFPPDFAPSKIKRRKMGKDPQMVIRLMAPFSMRCNRCGEYICEFPSQTRPGMGRI